MTITNALASLAVRDLAPSSQWYEKLPGPGSRPGLCTMFVSDDEIAHKLRSSDLAADAAPASHDRVDTIMIEDPDGTSIAFAMPEDASLAH
jgi:hypothetical protein